MSARTALAGLVIAANAFYLGAPAHAVDGVIEINHAKALAGGVTPGDTTPGFPVTISVAGSYRLTSNLYTGSRTTTAIEITADNVTLDLNGFEIACVRSGPFLCFPGTTGVGVDARTQSNVRVYNGTVRNMGAEGIYLGSGGLVERVRAVANGSGISVTAGTIQDCQVESNLGDGVKALDQTTVRYNHVRGNDIGLNCPGTDFSTACPVIGNFITRNIAFPRSGFFIVLGHNKECNNVGEACNTF